MVFYPEFIYIYLNWTLRHLPKTLTSVLLSLIQFKKSLSNLINDYWLYISHQALKDCNCQEGFTRSLHMVTDSVVRNVVKSWRVVSVLIAGQDGQGWPL